MYIYEYVVYGSSEFSDRHSVITPSWISESG